MKISEVYEKYQIPPLLQQHMYRVASVGRVVVGFLKPKMDLDIDVITKDLLLHDMGNIIKFSFDKNSLFSEEEATQLRKIQADFIAKYGNEEHLATETIAKELGMPEKVLHILGKTGSSKLALTVESEDWYIKVCSYSDFRVSPHGVVSIEDRFEEVKRRYAGREHVLADIEKTEKKKQLALILEKQIQEKCSESVAGIDDVRISQVMIELIDYEI